MLNRRPGPRTPGYPAPQPYRHDRTGRPGPTRHAARFGWLLTLALFAGRQLRTLAGWLWLWRDTFAPAALPAVVFAATETLLHNTLPVPGLVRVPVAVLATFAVARPLARRAWTAEGRAGARARRSARRLQARVREEWADIATNNSLVNRSQQIPAIQAVKAVEAGLEIALKLPPGLTLTRVRSQEEALATSFDTDGSCSRVSVWATTKSGGASLVTMLAVFNDPLGKSLGPWPLLGTQPDAELPDPALIPARELGEKVVIGRDERGRTVSTSLVEQNLLIGGLPGAGKTATLQQLVAAYALCPPEQLQLWLFDPKVVDLRRWKDRAAVYVGLGEFDKAIAALTHLVKDVMPAINEQLQAEGRTKAVPGVHTFRCLVIDEIAAYTAEATPEQRKAITQLLTTVIQRGRSAGIFVIAATQRPTVDVIPTAIRDLFSLRMALRTAEASNTQIILGDGAFGDASRIDPDTKGVALFRSEEDADAVRMRSYFLTDDQLAALVARAGTVTPLQLPDTTHQPNTDQAAPASSRPGAPVSAVDEQGRLVLCPERAYAAERVVAHLGHLDPAVVDVPTATAAMVTALAPHAGLRVPKTTPAGQNHPGYWVQTATLMVKLDERHKVLAVYPRG